MIGTAGWSIPKAATVSFPSLGSHLERYGQQLTAVEINTSFYRSHRFETYARWAAAVPPSFGFSVKIPKSITHVRRLVEVADLLDRFAIEVAGLGEKMRIALVQLPPSLAFDPVVAGAFFGSLRARMAVMIACEPRHVSWYDTQANQCLLAHQVARVAAHPVLVPGGENPGGWQGLHYHRLHGAPRTYYSSYERPFLQQLADGLRANPGPPAEQWCIFDNTASGAAIVDALKLQERLVR